MNLIKHIFLGIALASITHNIVSADTQQFDLLSIPAEVIQNHILSRLDQASLLHTRFVCSAWRNIIVIETKKPVDFDLNITSEQEPQFSNQTSGIIFTMLMHNQLTIKNHFSTTAKNHLNFSNINQTGLTLFCSLFNTNKNSTLKVLHLNNNALGKSAITPLTNALATNSSITELDLGFNELNSDHINDLSTMLLRNSTLKTLYLYKNTFGNGDITSLTNALIANTSLTTLDLGENKLKKDHIKELAIMLKQNSSLKNLHLAKNNIDTEGAFIITESISQNTYLTVLDLTDNKAIDFQRYLENLIDKKLDTILQKISIFF